ncbi:MAG: hypothetical protein HDS71_09380 [Bacteroidales bacterium]|nr:hypothetical protein [Bacteroidales bacterium]MBD5205469.1 hypothetical protein [Bacteroidales bacterium]MBD5224236.1 hypothetical protein [Bacteroidales bacterium]MBD5302715.1 hypothetical protein [Bacteroides sp.]
MFIPVIKPILRIVASIGTFIIFVLTILAAYGGRISPEYLTLPSTLTLVFPYLAWASFIITLLWIGFGYYIRGAFGVLTLIIVWSPATTASPLGCSRQPDNPAQTFRIMTYNMIHGWDLENKGGDRNRTIQYILDSGCDIVCLQELRAINDKEIPLFTTAQQDSLRKIYPYQLGDPSLDTKVLSKYPGVMKKADSFFDGKFDRERYSFYELDVKGHKLTLVNVHLMSFMLTSKEREVFTGIHSIEDFKTSYREIKGDIHKKLKRGFMKRQNDSDLLRKALNKIQGALVVCGDFNDVPESYAYRLIKGDDMKDAYVETNFGPMFTYNRHAMWFHIDQILYRGPLEALSVRKGNIKTSDHYPLIAEFEFTTE